LLRFSKVSRRKGGTHSSRYPNNGYVLDPIQHPGRLSGRHREQAPSHIFKLCKSMKPHSAFATPCRLYPNNGSVLNQEATYANV
ncbi:hypothetical protein, partial [Pseudomonas paralactis]|uniref:hypothetical protein n=1 Tax=Pseudomonas paralactis TaxID=1615673 RepID=UPI001E499447